MTKIRITRTASIPDNLRISRYKKNPESGPRILFFSGGSALSSMCKTLKHYTHNSIHLVTPFDSGGSSAKLRNAFDMPAIGDLRSRLMALADESLLGHPEIYQLFGYRFSRMESQHRLRKQLQQLAAGESPMVADIVNPMRQVICSQLEHFLQVMPDDFDLQGASIGNLILAGGYLNNKKNLDRIISQFSKWVNTQGTVKAVIDDNLHLGAKLADGSQLIGQHKLTGKEVAPLNSSIKQLFLCQDEAHQEPVEVKIRKKNRKLIESSDLICYPPGSFYTSVLANLLPNGVTSAIAENDNPKLYIPNLGTDPEQLGMNLEQQVATLLCQLQHNGTKAHSADKVLNCVLLDSKHGKYASSISQKFLKQTGIKVIDTRLVSKKSAPYYDNELLVAALLSIV